MNLSGIDLNLLVALDALLAERSVTRAARRLGLSQPATSHALARLRELLGDPLLVRGPARTMTPTPRALALGPALARALASVREVLSGPGSFDPSTAARRFAIASADLGSFELLPRLLPRLRRLAPGIDLDLRATPDDDLDSLLARPDIDMAIAPNAATRPSVHQMPLVRERFVCLLRKGHPALRRPLTLERFCAMPHLLVSPRGRPGGIVDDLLAHLGKRRRVALSVPQFLLAPHLVASSDLIWTAPESAASLFSGIFGLAQRPPPLQLEGFVMSLFWHERSLLDDGHRWLREQIAASVKSTARRPRREG